MKKYEIICARIRSEILDGTHRQGEKLPSIRACVEQFHLSKTTVEHAFAQLQLEGYITARAQKGYYVAMSEQNRRLHEELLRFSAHPRPALRYDLRSQSVLPEESELIIWRQYLKKAMNDADIGSYGDAQGESVLRASLARYASERGIWASREQVVIGASVQSLLYQLCGLLEHGQSAALQQGAYRQAQRVFEDYGMKVRPISAPLSSHSLPDADVIYLYPPALLDARSFSRAHQEALMREIQARGILLIEDDHNGELSFLRPGATAMGSFSEELSSVYLGSFSRILLPALRISYMILPRALAARYRARDDYGPGASKLEQIAFASYIADGHLHRRITRLKRRYRRRHDTLMRFAQEAGWELTRLEESTIRYHFQLPYVCTLNTGDLMQEGIAVDALQGASLTLSFSATADLEEALHHLSETLQERRA